MAGIPLNTFRTITADVKYLDPVELVPTGIPGTGNTWFVYTAPPGTTGIILYMQVSNVDPGNNYTASAWHYRPSTTTYTNIVKDIACPIADVRILLGGKLVLETADQVYVSGNDTTESNLKLIISVLESANQ